jgi:hypothetical protein
MPLYFPYIPDSITLTRNLIITIRRRRRRRRRRFEDTLML